MADSNDYETLSDPEIFGKRPQDDDQPELSDFEAVNPR